jgi:hypothetical protein
MNEEPRKGYCEAAKRTPNYKLRTSDLCGPCDPRLQRCCVALRAGLAAIDALVSALIVLSAVRDALNRERSRGLLYPDLCGP